MTTTQLKKLRRRAPMAAALAFAALASQAHAAIEFTDGQLSYQQNFDSLPNQNGSDPVWTNDATLPGWSIFVGPSLEHSVSQLRVSTSSGSDRAYISYGIHGNSDRALGSQGGSSHRYNETEAPATGEMFGAMAVSFINGTQSSLSGFSFDYTGEQWHVSSNANTAHSLTVQYALGAAGTAFNQLSWLDFTAGEQNAAGVHFFSPVLSGGTSGNGNLAGNRVTGLGASVTGLDWQSGQALWVRWVDINDPASDHGLAIDNFSLSVTPVPEPETYGMLLAGLGLVGLMKRRRKAQGASAS